MPVTLHSLQRHRRGSARLPHNARVEVISPTVGSGVTINMSEGGLRVAVDCELNPGDICLLYIDDYTQPERLERAKVAWSREFSDGWIVGLQVIGLH